MGNSIQEKYKEMHSFIFLMGITISVSLKQIRKMVEEFIVGLKMSRMCMKENFKMGEDMKEGLFGGRIGADMREISSKVGKLDSVHSIEKEK